jgi:hypothetical protein
MPTRESKGLKRPAKKAGSATQASKKAAPRRKVRSKVEPPPTPSEATPSSATAGPGSTTVVDEPTPPATDVSSAGKPRPPPVRREGQPRNPFTVGQRPPWLDRR